MSNEYKDWLADEKQEEVLRKRFESFSKNELLVMNTALEKWTPTSKDGSKELEQRISMRLHLIDQIASTLAKKRKEKE